jgi:hypothetical protein
MHNHNCVICKKEFKSTKKVQKTCSKTCMGINNRGSNNPNFGNKWTNDQRSHFSEVKIEQYKNNPKLADECGKSNRGIKFSEDRILAMHGNRTSASYKRIHSDTTKQEIGVKSKEKFTPEYKIKFRETMEKNGQWIPLSEKDPYEIYYKESNWIGNMIECFSANEKDSLNEHGIFNKNNTIGWVRDHIVPRMVGYEFKIPPVLLRHPANLQFISHADNVKKGFADRKLTFSEKTEILNSLFNRIMQYTLEWVEQDDCVNYIKGKIK